ncbi:MAG TPA: hypothetical protein VEW90_08275 [Gaiellaceae bacterium]|nr:hypothetical protein [Gaiellaceae bacterium]
MARALAAAVIGTVQVPRDPRQAPLHERSFQPGAGVATSRTGLNEANDAEQRGRHVMPGFELRIAPLPATETFSRNTAGPKVALTEAPGATVRLQTPAPEQAPPQRMSRVPAAGVATSDTGCPLFHVVVHVVVHKRPGTFDATDPVPEIVSASGA